MGQLAVIRYFFCSSRWKHILSIIFEIPLGTPVHRGTPSTCSFAAYVKIVSPGQQHTPPIFNDDANPFLAPQLQSCCIAPLYRQ